MLLYRAVNKSRTVIRLELLQFVDDEALEDKFGWSLNIAFNLVAPDGR